ncbi:HAMP domain-containing sensor histidine kinase [Anaerobium acetethylicum]|uniref:histidine kinase n=1 Tax=Anaerobium acetethylicum TaxID=1619234 RepID=A0A1D3TNF8_9FIRM|nr:HAMP domain-containing sensor histidine kinase [Anaerobium acetethylicum]SCP94868.1 Signal transduction histidine kinase [Anaerobium acetethylicum]
MRILHREPEDQRITRKKSFLKEYLIVLSVMLVSCTGAVLMFNEFMIRNASPWVMALCISSYVLFMGFIVSLATRYIMHTGFIKPVSEIGRAARKVAGGDFTVRIRSKRRDGKKDEMEVLIDDFNKMVEEIATIETLKGDFIANVSHEIKTPLAIIQSYASALRKDELSRQEKDEYIQTIIDASKRLSGLVSNVLRLNKLDSQEIIEIERFSLDEQLRCCILALEEKFDEKMIELDAELDEVEIASDYSLLEIVWNNLLTNAIKFTEPGGMITVGLKQEGNLAIIKIKDTGCGMDENTARRVFDRFYQGDTSHSTEGNGLGLSLVKRVLDLVGGKISVVSEVGAGTTFTIRMGIFQKMK